MTTIIDSSCDVCMFYPKMGGSVGKLHVMADPEDPGTMTMSDEL